MKSMRSALALGALLAASMAVAAEDRAGTGASAVPERPATRDDGLRTLRALPANLGRGLIGVFHADSLTPLMAGATATGAASFFDGRVREAVVDTFAWSDTFETAGGPLYSTIFVAGMFTAGRFVEAPRFGR
jgi:hypothetical protein